jgi:hypothetical protein
MPQEFSSERKAHRRKSNVLDINIATRLQDLIS